VVLAFTLVQAVIFLRIGRSRPPADPVLKENTLETIRERSAERSSWMNSTGDQMYRNGGVGIVGVIVIVVVILWLVGVIKL
jgi:hypothetical protein